MATTQGLLQDPYEDDVMSQKTSNTKETPGGPQLLRPICTHPNLKEVRRIALVSARPAGSELGTPRLNEVTSTKASNTKKRPECDRAESLRPILHIPVSVGIIDIEQPCRRTPAAGFTLVAYIVCDPTFDRLKCS
jgi:hypothetical protein